MCLISSASCLAHVGGDVDVPSGRDDGPKLVVMVMATWMVTMVVIVPFAFVVVVSAVPGATVTTVALEATGDDGDDTISAAQLLWFTHQD